MVAARSKANYVKHLQVHFTTYD